MRKHIDSNHHDKPNFVHAVFYENEKDNRNIHLTFERKLAKIMERNEDKLCLLIRTLT